jgi:hypothetical protein
LLSNAKATVKLAVQNNGKLGAESQSRKRRVKFRHFPASVKREQGKELQVENNL